MFRKSESEKKLNYTLIIEKIFLIMMALLIIYYFLSNTMFGIEWDNTFLFHLRNIVTAVVILKILTKNDYDMNIIMFMGLVLLIFYVSYINDTSDSQIVDVILLIIGSYGIRIEKIAKTYFVTTLLILSITVISSMTGYITNQADTGNLGGYISYCLGTTNHFWITASIFYLTCAYLIIRNEKIELLELILLEVVNVLFFVLSFSLNHLICISLILLCVFLSKCTGDCDEVGKLGMLLGCLIPVISSVGSVLFLKHYDNSSSIMKELNIFLGNRLAMCKQGYDSLGFSIWGKRIVTFGSSYATKYSQSSNDFIIDSGYLYLTIKYGILVFGIFLALLLWMNYRACLNKQKILLIICCVNAIQFVFARDMFFVNCNFLIWCVFSSFNVKNGSKCE